MNSAAKELLARGLGELGLQLSSEKLDMLDLYGDELKRWNAKINLTAIKKDEEIVLKHFVDSLTVTSRLKATDFMMDLGSGAGFPSIPLKIAMPELKVVSVDAVEKKILFQRHLVRLLNLQKFEAVHGRGENLKDRFGEQLDVVVSRAFSDIPTFAAMALPLIKDSGVIIAMKGREGSSEAAAASDVVAKLGGCIAEVYDFSLPLSDDWRSFVIITKGKP